MPAASPVSDTAPRTAAEITKRAKSNLAYALISLPEQRRQDMITFYAFCRLVDDIADDPGPSLAERKVLLERWRMAILEPQTCDPAALHPVLAETLALAQKYDFPTSWLAEIVEGVASDQEKNRYANFAELQTYCYKVASAVGLVSACIFGAQQPGSRDYAIQLGYALQLTNILRDVGEDARESGRIYLPLDEMQRFGVTEQGILDQCPGPGFLPLMQFQHQRAMAFYTEAERLLPSADRRHMIAARTMASIYLQILKKLDRTGYRVFERRERLSSLHKVYLLFCGFIRGRLGW